MLVLYWLLFTAPVFLCRPEIFPPESRPVFLSLNNGVFFWLASGYLRLRYPQEYWIFAVAFGAVLLALAALARLRRAEEYVFDGAYLVQGLACVTYGIAVKFSGASLALTLAVESLLLLGGVRRRHGIIYRIAGVGVACWSFVLTMVTLDSAPAKIVPLGLSVAALLLLAAWWLKRGSGWLMPLQWSSRAALLAAQGMALITYVVIQKLDHTLQPAAFTVAAVIATASLYWVAMPEILLFGQLWLLLGVFLGIEMVMSVEQIVWWRILIPHAAALGLAHWWQRQRKMPDLRVLPFDGLCAAALVALGFFTLQAHFAGPGFSLFTTYFDFTGWAIAASFAGVATLAYGWGTQLWSLAAFGQMFSAAAVATWLAHLSADRLPWWAALLIISGVIAPAELATRLAEAKDRATAAKDEPPDPVTVIAPFYWAAAAILVAIWIFAYLPWRWQTFAFAGIGLALLAPRSPRPWQCVIGFGYFVLVYGGTILGHFGLLTGPGVLSLFGSLAPRWPGARRNDCHSCLSPPAANESSSFLCGSLRGPHPRERRRNRGNMGLVNCLGMGSRSAGTAHHRVGRACHYRLCRGSRLRERVYRVGGFAILALAILRVFLVDVWRLETVWRIISFLVLGAVLLALGFVYNRFAEQIRKWL